MTDVALTDPTAPADAEDCAGDDKPDDKAAELLITAAEAEQETTDVPEFGGSCYHNAFCSH